MAWGRLEDTFYDDPKFQHIADELNIDVVMVQGFVARLYSWAVKHRPDGSLDSLTTVYIERTLCRWTGSDGALLDAFVAHEVIDKDDKGLLTIHGLMALNESYKRAQIKKKEREEKQKKRLTTVATLSHDSRYQKTGEEKRDLLKLEPDEPKPSPAASQPGVTVPIRQSWIREYENKYGQPPIWGRKENGQAAQLLGSLTVHNVVEMIPYFFAWERPEVIKSGHSFGTGANCFVMKIHELRADMANPQRRADAAQAANTERSNNQNATSISAAERLANRISGVTHGKRLEGNEAGSQRVLGFGETHLADV